MKAAESISIIGGADGPTSIFLAGRSGKRPLKIRIRNRIFQLRRNRIARRIRPNAPTLREVAVFMKKHYGAVELSRESREYKEQKECLKGSLMIEHRPELLGGLSAIPRPRVYEEASIRKLYDRLQRQRERIAQIPDEQFPMDFHVYRIRLGGGRMEIEIDYQWETFGISYSGNKKEMRKLRRISRRLYIYYGVSEEDIRNCSKRYSSLLTVLASD